MTNNKQSSVEWLVKELNQKIDFIPMNRWDEIKEVIEKAKAMHNKEIEKAFDNGVNAYYDINSPSNWEQYYNETFGGNNEME